MVTILAPQQVKQLLEERSDCQLLDVREFVEYAAGHVPAAKLIPLGQIGARVGELDPARPVIVLCKGGKRAAQAAEILCQHGCREVTVVAGGTDAWADGLFLENFKIITENLDGDLAFDAGNGFFHVVLDDLGKVELQTGEYR